jgi:hypothetical protein
MQQVTLKKDGLYFSFWDEASSSWIDKIITSASFPISWYLPYSVKIEGELTIRDILLILKPHRDLVQLIFANSLGGINIDEVYETLNQPGHTETKAPMNCIYLFKMGEVIPVENQELMFYNIYPVLMGLNIVDEIEGEDVYHLSSHDLRSWCDLQFGIDGFFEYVDVTNDELVMEGIIAWQLFEVIGSILSQISITLQVTQTIKIGDRSKLETGPMKMEELYVWFEELDQILLGK